MPNNIVLSNPGGSLIKWGDATSTPYLTLSSVPSSGTVGVAVSGVVSNAGSVSATWAISTSPADTLISPSSGTLAAGANVAFTLTALASGLKNVLLTSSTPGATINGSPMSFTAASVPAPAPSSPLDLLLGAATPEQIGVRATWNTTRTAGTLVRMQYKLPASGTWTDGPWLSEFLAAEVLAINANAPGSGGGSAQSGLSVVDGFGGFAYHLDPGVTYDVRLAVTLPAASTVYTASQSHTTRALPTSLPAANKTCTTATLTAALAGLVAGDHLQLQAGTYPPFTVSASGTSGSPIYISCATGASVVYAAADKIITVNGSDIVFDSMTITGTGVDSERAYMLAGGSMAGVYSTAFYSSSANTQRVTVRNCTITGVDIGFKLWAQSDQWLIYNNTITGNNLHDVQYTIPPGDTYPRAGWNDTCINWHGSGNCAWNNTIQGFGDTVKFGFSTAPNGFECRGNHFYRNKVLRGADDGVEFDNSCSGSSYRNYFANVATLASFDGAFEGPFDVFENVAVNVGYGPLKMNSGSVNARFFHNTFVLTVKHGADHGLLASNVATHYRTKFQNNVVVYRGAGNMVHWSAPLASSPAFDHNAWYSSTDDFMFTTPISGSAGDLTTAKATFAPFMVGDVNTTSNPFSATITLGANAQTEYTDGVFDVTLAGGATPLNAGVALSGYNDGYTGAAPTMGAVWGGQAAFTVGQTDAPAWVVGKTVNTWGVIPASNTLADLNPDNDASVNPNYPSTAPWRSTGNYATMVTAWNGAAFDGTGGVMWWTDTGGHGDKYDNGVYKLDLNRAVPLYTRVLAPSGSVGMPTVSYPEYSGAQLADYSDGRGRPKHTYNYAFYLPGVGPGLATEITLSPSGGTAAGSFRLQTFNESTGARTVRANGAAELGSGCAAEYDSLRDAVWKRPVGNAPMRKWDKATDTWSSVGADQNYNGPWSLSYLPDHDCMLMGNGSDDGLGQSVAGGWQVFDCATGSYYTPTFTGAPALGVANANGLWPGMCQPRWAASLGCFLAWDNSSNTTKVMTITPPANPRTGTWVISELTVSGSNAVTPSVAATNGTYGRFFVHDGWGICGVINSVNEAGYFFRYR